MCETKHKHYDLIIAWANGAPVQFQVNFTKEWVDIKNPSWSSRHEYRIKPEPKPDVVQSYRVSHKGTVWAQSVSNNVECTFDGETGDLKSVRKI